MIKAVFVDIDGTLVNREKQILESTKLAVQKAKEQGIEVVICSGRHRLSALPFKECCQMSRYMIGLNGAEIYDCETKEVLYESIIDVETCQSLYEIANKEDCMIKFSFRYGMAMNKIEYKEEAFEIELEEDIQSFLKSNRINEISIGSKNKDSIEKAKKQIESNSEIRISHERHRIRNGEEVYFVHYTNSNVSKANSMAGLCKYLKIDLKETVAIGDGTNDISMIEMAGCGVAMENALDEVKNVADMVTSSNEEDGVGKVLEKILQEK